MRPFALQHEIGRRYPFDYFRGTRRGSSWACSPSFASCLKDVLTYCRVASQRLGCVEVAFFSQWLWDLYVSPPPSLFSSSGACVSSLPTRRGTKRSVDTSERRQSRSCQCLFPCYGYANQKHHYMIHSHLLEPTACFPHVLRKGWGFTPAGCHDLLACYMVCLPP